MIGKLAVERLQVGEIKPAVQRGQVSSAVVARQGEMEIIDVKMDQVEPVRVLKDLFEQDNVVRELVHASVVEPKRTGARSDQLGLRHRIAAGEQGDVVPLSYEFLGQIRDDALGASITVGRNAFIKRSDLCDSHARGLLKSPRLPTRTHGVPPRSLCEHGPRRAESVPIVASTTATQAGLRCCIGQAKEADCDQVSYQSY